MRGYDRATRGNQPRGKKAEAHSAGDARNGLLVFFRQKETLASGWARNFTERCQCCRRPHRTRT